MDDDLEDQAKRIDNDTAAASTFLPASQPRGLGA
jgi:hypothetical protein